MKLCPVVLAAVLVGCGGSSPTAPTPTPSPATFTGSVTDTVTGAPVSGFTALITGGRLTVSAPGYVTRETRAGTSSIDLIPEAGFHLDFYRQFARDTVDGAMRPLVVLSQAPSMYLQTSGLSGADVAALLETARAVIPDLTGGRFSLGAWETGPETRSRRSGWITVDLTSNEAQSCGQTLPGAAEGHIILSIAARCGYEGRRIDPPLFAHELGHALGFFHVSAMGHLMHPRATFAERRSVLPSDLERHHAAIAYKRTAGNRDIDIDP